MKRALTLIELLLSLTLLSAIIIAAGAWTQITGHAATSAAEPMRLRMATDAVFELIHDDLASGDLGSSDAADSAHSTVSRVTVVENALAIETRAPGFGAVLHRYHLNLDSNELVLGNHLKDDHSNAMPPPSVPRRLLRDVRRFAAELKPVHQTLTVTIEFSSREVMSRMYRLP